MKLICEIQRIRFALEGDNVPEIEYKPIPVKISIEATSEEDLLKKAAAN